MIFVRPRSTSLMRRFCVLIVAALAAAALAGPAVAAGPPSRVKNINPDGGSNPLNLTSFQGKVYFSANDGTHGQELWKSNGRALGTKLVMDINPLGTRSSSPMELTSVGSTLFFTAFERTHGRELWKTDGTAAGTVLVRDIIPGRTSSTPEQLTNVDGTLFFVGYNAKGGELWKSDGTAAGTVRVKDIWPGSRGSQPFGLTAAEDRLFFSAEEDHSGRQLFVSDGTSAGTHGQLPCGQDPQSMVHVGTGRTVDFFSSAPGNFVCRYNDTTGGATELTGFNEIDGASLYKVGNRLFFVAVDSAGDHSLWKSNGTTAGTGMVEPLPMFGAGAGAAVGSKLFLPRSDGTDTPSLWVSNGTEAGTHQVEANPEYSYPEQLTNVGGQLFFVAVDLCGDTCGGNYEIWTSDGTDAGTHQVAEIVPGTSGPSPTELTNVKGVLYFAADNDANGMEGMELWKYIP